MPLQRTSWQRGASELSLVAKFIDQTRASLFLPLRKASLSLILCLASPCSPFSFVSLLDLSQQSTFSQFFDLRGCIKSRCIHNYDLAHF